MTARLRDILLGTIFGAFFFPIGLIIGAFVKLDSPGPIFYFSPRIGRHGKKFLMCKFRTMYDDSAELLTPLQQAEFHCHFKLANDPRVTRVGRWLRRLSLDEVPQLLNVIRGDMTLVGPRPKLPDEIDLYGEDVDELLSILPGMTGYWQVYRTSANSDATMRTMDLYYVRNRSMGLDLRLLGATFAAILRHNNG